MYGLGKCFYYVCIGFVVVFFWVIYGMLVELVGGWWVIDYVDVVFVVLILFGVYWVLWVV